MVTVEALGGTPYFLFKANAVEPNDDWIWAKRKCVTCSCTIVRHICCITISVRAWVTRSR
jgi:hypothetical protein